MSTIPGNCEGRQADLLPTSQMFHIRAVQVAGLLVALCALAQIGEGVFVKKYFQDKYLAFRGHRHHGHHHGGQHWGREAAQWGNGQDGYGNQHSGWQRQWNGDATSFEYYHEYGCPVLNQCYQNYFQQMGFMGSGSFKRQGGDGNWDMEMCRSANHDLYQCFQEAFHGEQMCECSTWQVEEAAMYIHGFETDYSRHMNMHCQGFHDYYEQDQQCDEHMMQCAAKMEYLMWNDLRYKCSRRQDIQEVRECFHQMRSNHGQQGCQYLQWFYRMGRDSHVDQLFQLFQHEIEGCPVHQIMYSCGHDYDRMGPSVMCAMRNHYMREYTQCMTRMMNAVPECHAMSNMQNANRELMQFFMQDQCQMNRDVHMTMSHCCHGNKRTDNDIEAEADNLALAANLELEQKDTGAARAGQAVTGTVEEISDHKASRVVKRSVDILEADDVNTLRDSNVNSRSDYDHWEQRAEEADKGVNVDAKDVADRQDNSHGHNDWPQMHNVGKNWNGWNDKGKINKKWGNYWNNQGNLDKKSGNGWNNQDNLDRKWENGWNSQDNLDKKSGNGWNNQGHLDKKSGNGWNSQGNLDKKSGNGWNSQGNLDKKSGNGWNSQDNLNKKSGNGWNSQDNLDKKCGNGWNSQDNLDKKWENGWNDKGNIDKKWGDEWKNKENLESTRENRLETKHFGQEDGHSNWDTNNAGRDVSSAGKLNVENERGKDMIDAKSILDSNVDSEKKVNTEEKAATADVAMRSYDDQWRHKLTEDKMKQNLHQLDEAKARNQQNWNQNEDSLSRSGRGGNWNGNWHGKFGNRANERYDGGHGGWNGREEDVDKSVRVHQGKDNEWEGNWNSVLNRATETKATDAGAKSRDTADLEAELDKVAAEKKDHNDGGYYFGHTLIARLASALKNQ